MATKKKAQPKEGTVTSPERKATSGKKTAKKTVSNDIIGSNVPPKDAVDINLSKAPAKAENETVAIHSTKNVVWEGVGKVEKGYNILKKSEAEKWLTRGHTRIATPEEVAREYGA